jgi:hypothetical protein
VEANAGIGLPPFTSGNPATMSTLRPPGTLCSTTTDDFKDVMALKVVEGRWFDASDDAVNFDPVVINQPH